MLELFPSAKIDVLDRSDWNSLVKKRNGDSSVHLNTVFFEAAKEARKLPDVPLAEVYELLSQVFSMYFKADDPSTPFGPMAQVGVTRTALVTDFSEQNLSLFEHMLTGATDFIVVARLADVLWLRRKDRKFAQRAIDAYLEHVRNSLHVGDAGWLQAKESLHRASQICKKLGQPSSYFDQLIKAAEDSLRLSDPEPENYFRILILRVMGEFRLCSDPQLIADKCDHLANLAQSVRNYDKARSYWECATEFVEVDKDTSKKKLYSEKLTDSFVAEARDLRSAKAKAMIVSDRYSKAIEACRRIGGRRALIDDLHREMNEVQETVLQEMKRTEVSLDVTKLVESGRKAVSDIPLESALANIAAMATPQKKSQLRASVKDASSKFVFMNLVSGVSFNEKGRVVARTSPVLATDEITKEAGIQAQMLIQCSQAHQLAAMSQIEAAREVLNERIPTDSSIFYDLVMMNPFVPSGRESIYVRGLTAGLNADWLVCAHLLIPQIEHSIRTYLERSGALVTRLTDELIQKEHDLNKLLYEPSTEKIFGEDLVFSIRALLVEEVGGNYRNRLAHGLLSDDQFHAAWVNYLWALTIRLCWLGKLVIQRQSENHGESKNADDEKISPIQGEEEKKLGRSSSEPVTNGDESHS